MASESKTNENLEDVCLLDNSNNERTPEDHLKIIDAVDVSQFANDQLQDVDTTFDKFPVDTQSEGTTIEDHMFPKFGQSRSGLNSSSKSNLRNAGEKVLSGLALAGTIFYNVFTFVKLGDSDDVSAAEYSFCAAAAAFSTGFVSYHSVSSILKRN